MQTRNSEETGVSGGGRERERDLLLSDTSEKNLFFQSYKGVVIRERCAFRERKKREHTSAYVSIRRWILLYVSVY